MTIQMVPNKGELERYLEQGMTQAQIVDAWESDSGVRVSRSSIGMAIERYDLRSARPRPRYEDTLPWTVLDEHTHHNDARMLRLEGRRRRGGSLTAKELRVLNAWLQLLDEKNAVIHYDPQTERGFWWVPRTEGDADIVHRP